jgi:hypothetical protein
MGAMRNACKTYVGNREQKKQLGRPRRRWEANIRMNLRYTEWETVNWINLAQNTDR